MQEFENGAKRSAMLPRYDLIPFEALEALAMRFTEGAGKYGDNNFKLGGPIFAQQAIEHMYEHLGKYCHPECSPEDDLVGNLAGVMWGAAYLIWYEKNRKAVNLDEHL